MFEDTEEGKSKRKRVYTTVYEMTSDRGYRLSNFEPSLTKDQVMEYYGDHSCGNVRFTKRNNDADQILVSFIKTLSAKLVRETKSQMQREGVQSVIFVVQDRITPIAKIECANSVNVHFQVFRDSELLFNVTKHKLVPVYQILTKDEKKALLLKYTLKESEMPGLQENDPIAKYHGCRPGQVVKITRISETAGKYNTYRRVFASK